MNKLFKAAAAFALSAALLIPQSVTVYAEPPATAAPTNPTDTADQDNAQTTPDGGQTPVDPDNTTPTNPDNTTPTNPDNTTPTNPDNTTPTTPDNTTPTNPDNTTPTNPDNTTPTNPDGNTTAEKSNPSKPVLVGYSLTNSSNRALTSISPNSEFNITITIKDIGLKTSQVKGNADIDFIKSVDSFRGTLKSVEITSKPDELLTYKVTVEKCKWIGGSTDFGFMTGFLSLGSDYTDMTFAVRECRENTSTPAPDYSSTAEPLFRITAEQLVAPIKAGEEGSVEFTLKNLGSVEAERVLVEVSASEDLLITDGTGSQDINIIYSGSSDKIKIRYKAADMINSAKQTFTVSLRYYYDNGNGEVTGTSTGTVSFESVVSTIEKVYPVVLSEFDLSEKLVDADKEYSGTVTLNNIGSADMKGVFINFSSGGDFILTGGTSTVFLPELEKGKSYRVPIKIKTLSGFNSLKQDLSVSVRYSYTVGSEDKEGTMENTFTMFANMESAYAPLPVVSISGQETPISAGHKYRYQIVIENKGELDMDNVTVKLKGGEGISIASSNESAFIAKIPAGGKQSIPMSFETAAELVSSKVGVDIDLSYFYENNGKNEQASAASSVSMDSIVSGAPIIRMTGNSLGKAVVAKNEYEYTLNLTNYGDIAVKDIYLNLTTSDSLYMLDGSEYAHIDSIAAGSTTSVKVKFRTTDSITSAKQSIHARITYSYGVANAEKTAETDGEVSIIAAGASESSSSSNTAAPNVIIGSYSICMEDTPAEQIPAGDAFDLNLELFNTSSALGVENLVMTVNASGDISIYGGGNTFFYPNMDAAGRIAETIPLKAMATAATGTSSVSIGLKYDYIDNGNRQTITTDQTIFVPVYQPDKMSFEVQMPTYSVYAGNQVYITTTYLNKGRSDIANIKAEIVGDIEALSNSKVIGTVVPGGNGSFDFIVTPYMGGECSFTIKITYEDATMTEITKEFPVTFMVEEMVWDDPGMWDFPMTMEPEGGSGGFPWLILWIGIGVLVVGGVVTLIIVLNVRKKKKKKLTEADIDWEDDLDDVLSDKKETKV